MRAFVPLPQHLATERKAAALCNKERHALGQESSAQTEIQTASRKAGDAGSEGQRFPCLPARQRNDDPFPSIFGISVSLGLSMI